MEPGCFPMKTPPFVDVGVSENSVPLNPMVFMIIIPIKWLFHWEYTLFSDKPMFFSLKPPICRWFSHSQRVKRNSFWSYRLSKGRAAVCHQEPAVWDPKSRSCWLVRSYTTWMFGNYELSHMGKRFQVWWDRIGVFLMVMKKQCV